MFSVTLHGTSATRWKWWLGATHGLSVVPLPTLLITDCIYLHTITCWDRPAPLFRCILTSTYAVRRTLSCFEARLELGSWDLLQHAHNRYLPALPHFSSRLSVWESIVRAWNNPGPHYVVNHIGPPLPPGLNAIGVRQSIRHALLYLNICETHASQT